MLQSAWFRRREAWELLQRREQAQRRIECVRDLFTCANAALTREPRFLFALVYILKYGNNSWHLSGWFPKSASRCARGSMRKVSRKHHARGSSCGSSGRPHETYGKSRNAVRGSIAEATAKTIIAEGSVEARYFRSADQMETSLRGSSAEGRGRKGCYF